MPKLTDLLADSSDKDALSAMVQQHKKNREDRRPLPPQKKPDSHVTDLIPDFVAIDVETTGLDYKADRIIEVGAVRFVRGVAQDEFSSLVNPGIPIPRMITDLTGIADSDVVSSPAFAEVAAKLLAFMGDLPLCGHQVDFDINFISEELKRSGGDKLKNADLDTALLSRTALPALGGYALGQVAESLSVTLKSAHRALDDARASGHVAVKCIPLLLQISSAARQTMAAIAPPSLLKEILVRSMGRQPIRRQDLPVTPPMRLKPIAVHATSEPVDINGLEKIFSTDGALRHEMERFVPRVEQTRLARCVAEACNDRSFLVAEAGTGTGKTLAYLVPAALYAIQQGRRVLIATHTRNLQDQLFLKDLPIVRNVVGDTLSYSILKGRSNYLCKNRFSRVMAGQLGNLSLRERAALLPLIRWAFETSTGDIEEQNQFSRKRHSKVWNLVSADAYDCLSRRCPFFDDCFLQQARQRALAAHIVVINHALFFSDVCAETSFLGSIGGIVFDEAHHLESCGHRHLRTEVDHNRVKLYLDFVTTIGTRIEKVAAIADAMGESGLTYKTTLKRLRKQTQIFLDDALLFVKENNPTAVAFQFEYTAAAFGERASVPQLDLALCSMQEALARLVEIARDKEMNDMLAELNTAASRTSQLKADVSYLCAARTEDHVFWIEGNVADGWCKLCGVPLDVGGLLAPLWQRYDMPLVFTSATLSVGSSFEYFKSRVGLRGDNQSRTRVESFASPFVSEQTLFCGLRGLPEPDAPSYTTAVAEIVAQLLKEFNKNILVLFTAQSMLAEVYELLKSNNTISPTQVMAQGFSGNRNWMLDRFKAAKNTVLLGTASFWEGVDAPGSACEIVIVPRLPFPVPTHPLVGALSRAAEKQNGESFMSFQIPEAITRFKQGAGRLIRTATDRGVFIVLDSRIISRGYGKQFVRSVASPFTAYESMDQVMANMRTFFDGDNSHADSKPTYVPFDEL